MVAFSVMAARLPSQVDIGSIGHPHRLQQKAHGHLQWWISYLKLIDCCLHLVCYSLLTATPKKCLHQLALMMINNLGRKNT